LPWHAPSGYSLTKITGKYRKYPETDMANLTKRDMVVKISEEVGITQQQAFAVIQKTLEHITESLAEGNNVELRNFGVFEVRLTKSRVGRNPNKPETDVVIPARATVKFKPGKIMRQRVLLRTEQLRQHNGA
jgi:nucleoid DNA-binding protein